MALAAWTYFNGEKLMKPFRCRGINNGRRRIRALRSAFGRADPFEHNDFMDVGSAIRATGSFNWKNIRVDMALIRRVSCLCGWPRAAWLLWLRGRSANDAAAAADAGIQRARGPVAVRP